LELDVFEVLVLLYKKLLSCGNVAQKFQQFSKNKTNSIWFKTTLHFGGNGNFPCNLFIFALKKLLYTKVGMRWNGNKLIIVEK
jgi:hypothetical protein